MKQKVPLLALFFRGNSCVHIWNVYVAGWVCYAEKTHGDFVLPYISSTKSPQQIMGSLVKSYLADQLGLKPNAVYHVTVMPCFDKKLEASRSDFYNDLYSTRDVDCVITAGKCVLRKFCPRDGFVI